MKANVKSIVSHHWKRKVKKVSKFGPVWKVKTKEGYFCLKRWKHGRPHLFFAYHVIEELWSRGYFGTPRLIADAQGKPFTEEKGEIYVLTKWVGRPLKEELKREWVLAARELANFHRISNNIELPPDIEGCYFSGKWLKRFPKRIEEMQKAFDLFQKPGNVFEEEVIRNAAVIMEIAETADNMMKESYYQWLSENLRLSPQLCHGNIKAKNFTVTEDGKVHIVDFDSFRFDLPVQDLAAFFLSALSSKGWSISFAQTLFDTYDQVRHIEPEELPILKALLIFPYELCKLIQKYQRGGKTPEAFLKKWDKEFARFAQQQYFFERWL